MTVNSVNTESRSIASNINRFKGKVIRNGECFSTHRPYIVKNDVEADLDDEDFLDE